VQEKRETFGLCWFLVCFVVKTHKLALSQIICFPVNNEDERYLLMLSWHKKGQLFEVASLRSM